MGILLQSAQGILTVVCIIGLGFFLARVGVADEKIEAFLATFVTRYALPPFMMANMLDTFTRQQLFSMAGGLVVPFLSILVCYVLARLAAKVFKVSKGRQGVFISVVFGSNVIYLGLPLCLALFGEECVKYVMLYYIANTSTFWTLSMHEIRKDAGVRAPIFSLSTIKSVLTPPFMGFLAGLFIVLLAIPLPVFFYKACKYVGSTATPLAMLFIGMVMSRGKWSELEFNKDVVTALVGRFFLSPACVALFMPIFHLPTLMGQVFVLEAAMPAMVNISIIAKEYGGDYKYAAELVLVSTVLAVVTIPIYMLMLQG